MPAAAPSGSSHCRQVTAGAWSRGPGRYVRIAILLPAHGQPGPACEVANWSTEGAEPALAAVTLPPMAIVALSTTKTERTFAGFSRTRPRSCDVRHMADIRPVPADPGSASAGDQTGRAAREPA